MAKNRAVAYHQEEYTVQLTEALCYFCGGEDECVEAGKGVRAE